MDILFCHDFKDFADTKAEIWETKGHTVTVRTSAVESLRAVKSGEVPFDVVIFIKI